MTLALFWFATPSARRRSPGLAFASGLVTDAGGVLSHAAIVARELGIPAVVGTRGATDLVETGSKVTVDDQLGLVLIER